MNFEHLANLITITCYLIIGFITIVSLVNVLPFIVRVLGRLRKPKRQISPYVIDGMLEDINELEISHERLNKSISDQFEFFNQSCANLATHLFDELAKKVDKPKPRKNERR